MKELEDKMKEFERQGEKDLVEEKTSLLKNIDKEVEADIEREKKEAAAAERD